MTRTTQRNRILIDPPEGKIETSTKIINLEKTRAERDRSLRVREYVVDWFKRELGL